MKSTNRAPYLLPPLALALVSFACTGENGGPPSPSDPQPSPNVGQTDFFSADGVGGQASSKGEFDDSRVAAPEASGGNDQSRTVEEGDIYQVTQNGLILNLNAYRGLQMIDFSDPANPEIIGRVKVAGSPVEMYQVGSRVYVLMNHWYGYYGNRLDLRPSTFQGGLVLAVDVSDPTNPVVTGRAQVPGYIRTSRLTRGGGNEALFVVAADGQATYVKSFTVSSAGALTARTEIDLGGWVTDIQATPSRLLVARHIWDGRDNNHGSDVSIIDITNPDGTMVQGADVRVAGMVQNKHNMDVEGDILRVVSANTWGSAENTNHVETFDAANIQTISPIDHVTFGDGENLFATIFLDDAAFFVTYRRVDPFHAFAIDATGVITEKSEFIVSGWNDFFRPVFADQRLVGIGKNDENGNTLAVSLYDITDLENPNPLLTRAEIDLDWSWSEANWDDRAFSVLEGATSVAASTGELETGLVLLPFSGWDDSSEEYISAVQIFTFSETTLTKRGVMNHGTPVRRSFLADPDDQTTGNLSEAELSLFNTLDPDSPVELGRVELAPNFTKIVTFDGHAVRRLSHGYYYYWWGGQTNQMPSDKLQVVSLSDDVDTAEALVEVEIPANAQLYKVGDDKLAAVSITAEYPENGGEPTVETIISLWSFAQPTAPVLTGSLTTTDLPLSYGGGYYGGYDECLGCRGGYYYGGYSGLKVVGDALVFPAAISERELEGVETIRSFYPNEPYCGANGGSGILPPPPKTEGEEERRAEPETCTYYSGGITCRSLARVDGTEEPEACTGAFYRCTQTKDSYDCVEVDASSVSFEESVYSYDRYRYWYHYDLHIVDVETGRPVLANTVSMDRYEEAVSLLANDSELYVTFKKPFRAQGDPRPFVRYFFRKLDLTNPSNAAVGPDINIPGNLVAVSGNIVVTRDFLWGQSIVETSINKLRVRGLYATLEAVKRFPDEVVEGVALDGQGHVLVSHGTAYYGVPMAGGEVAVDSGPVGTTRAGLSAGDDPMQKLTIFDLTGPLSLLAQIDIDVWASLRSAMAGRGLFTVPGGLLVVNLDNPSTPFAQAYFPVQGWPSDMTENDRKIYFAAGRFGLYEFDLDTFNLLPPEVE